MGAVTHGDWVWDDDRPDCSDDGGELAGLRERLAAAEAELERLRGESARCRQCGRSLSPPPPLNYCGRDCRIRHWNDARPRRTGRRGRDRTSPPSGVPEPPPWLEDALRRHEERAANEEPLFPGPRPKPRLE